GPVWQSQYGVNVTICGEQVEDRARLIGKETVIWYYHSRSSPRLENGQNVLEEIELLIGGRDGEVVPARRLIRSFCSEGRVGQHDVVVFGWRRVVDGIP